jgi:hypothetical protein
MTITPDTIRAAQNRIRFRKSLIESLCKLGGGPRTWEQASTMTLQEVMQQLGTNGLHFYATAPSAPGETQTYFSVDEMVGIYEELQVMDAEQTKAPLCSSPAV